MPHTWSRISTHLLWVYRSGKVERAGIIPVRGPFGTITVLSGVVEIRTEDGAYRAEKGETFVLPEGARVYRFSPEHLVLSAACTLRWPDSSPVLGLAEPLVLRGKESAAVTIAVERLLTAVYGRKKTIDWQTAIMASPRDFAHHAAITSQIWEWIHLMAEAAKAHAKESADAGSADPRVQQLRLRLNQADFSQRFRPEDFSQGLGLSWRRLEQLFREEMKLTPSEYYEHRRIWRARQLLGAGRRSVKEISFALGFRHQSSFSRWFLRHSGMSPARVLGHQHGKMWEGPFDAGDPLKRKDIADISLKAKSFRS